MRKMTSLENYKSSRRVLKKDLETMVKTFLSFPSIAHILMWRKIHDITKLMV